MKFNALLLCSAILVSTATHASPSDPPVSQAAPKVTLTARGADVRAVLADIFSQSKRSFVVTGTVRDTVFMSIADTSFDDALAMVCELADLQYEVRDNVYWVRKTPKPTAPPKVTPAPKADPEPADEHGHRTAEEKPSVKSPVKGTLPNSVLQKRVTTRLNKANIRSVFQEFTKQTGIAIEVDEQVPDYRVDAYLIKTSLQFALGQITRAAGLSYRMTDRRSILITRSATKVASRNAEHE